MAFNQAQIFYMHWLSEKGILEFLFVRTLEKLFRIFLDNIYFVKCKFQNIHQNVSH